MKSTKGFTLIELMVVVGIIAILSAIGLTTFNSAQANARDGRRRTDINAIANVLEITRVPGTAYYTSLPLSGFSDSKVPVDTTTAKYCIRTSTGTTAPDDPATWDSSTACPTTDWTSIPSGGIAVGTAPFLTTTNISSWKVCARLETGAFYCKPSSQ